VEWAIEFVDQGPFQVMVTTSGSATAERSTYEWVQEMQ
jgi:hypothetical protein